MKPRFPFHALVLSTSLLAVAILSAFPGAARSQDPVTAITLDASKEGHTFDGVGALSAGASSRLLIDYPEPQRSEILDYLFRPNYGAAIQHLKVEIGGDVNSTDGCEPSHMHTRDDENYNRGYEWWLMEEAKKRNPEIQLDCLAWGAPAWIGNGKFYSQDMADYVVKFIQGAKRVHGLDVNYTGIWNETRDDPEWIKLLRRTLDAAGLQRVNIVAADETGGDKWGILAQILKDRDLAAAVQVVGVHYPKFESPPEAKDLTKPVWASEDGPWTGGWGGSQRIAQMFNRNYILGKMTATQIWSPISSYYDNLPLPKSGLMTANEPWSGYYEVQPAVWAMAHTAQFVHPGWKYLDSGCVLIEGGSIVALKSPDGKDYSVILETTQTNKPQTLTFQTQGLSAKPLQVWHTTEKSWFIQEQDLTPTSGVLTLKAEPHSIYSLTTMTGQHKGGASPPAPKPFPLPYRDDFESYAPGSTPRYLSDQAGIFEVAVREDGKGKVLRQVVGEKGIEWRSHLNPPPETFLGSSEWRDYEVGIDALIEKAGYISLFGRVGKVPQNANPPDGYWLEVSDSGTWELKTVINPPKRGDKLVQTVLGAGSAAFGAGSWRHVALKFVGDTITVSIDGKALAEVKDATHSAGMAGLGCGWHGAQFDNLEVR